MKFSTTYQISLLMLISLFLTSCSGGSISVGAFDYPSLPKQTVILEVDIEPYPVIIGEEITFTCIIKDSLDPSFNYQWQLYLQEDFVIDSTITENSITITSTFRLQRFV